MPHPTEWEARFDKTFGDSLSLGSEPFNDAYVELHVKPYLIDFIAAEIEKAERRGREEEKKDWYLALTHLTEEARNSVLATKAGIVALLSDEH